MATKKVTQLTTATSAADLDLVMIVDVDDTAMSPEGTNKQITKANLLSGVGSLTQVSTTVNNTSVLRMKYDDLPIELVAGIAGKIIVPVGITILATQAGITETSSDDLKFGWDAANSGSGADNFTSIRDMMDGVTGGVTQSQSISPYANGWAESYNGDATGQPLEAWCNDVFNGGWSMVIYTTYYTITV